MCSTYGIEIISTFSNLTTGWISWTCTIHLVKQTRSKHESFISAYVDHPLISFQATHLRYRQYMPNIADFNLRKTNYQNSDLRRDTTNTINTMSYL